MAKRDNESYREYKQRVIDPISDSFCGAKWLNATIWLSNGSTASCHHPPAHKIPLEEIKLNPSALHNTKFKKLRRKEMLEGVRPPECEYCWKIEDLSVENVSDRTFKTVIHDDEDIEDISEAPWDRDVNPKTLEVAFDRVCNFACAYCNATFSTTWANDIRKNGYYKDLGKLSHYNNDGDHENIDPDNNPYIDAFWKWWPELSKTLSEIRVTGGEPLLSNNTWRLVEHFKQNPDSNLRLAINSNLGLKSHYIEKLCDLSHNVKDFIIYTSLESYGKHAEYARDGLDFELWRKNYDLLAEKGNFRSINIMMTINALSAFSTVEFLDMVTEIKKKHGFYKALVSVNILRFPDFLNITTLPEHLLKKFQRQLVEWYRKNENSEYFVDFELASIKRLIDYVGEITLPTANAQAKEERMLYFKRFVHQFDERRNKNHREVFDSDLVEWLESLPD